MDKKWRLLYLIPAICIMTSCDFISHESSPSESISFIPVEKKVTLTIIDGEHYSVKDSIVKVVDGSCQIKVDLEEGYRLTNTKGIEGEISEIDKWTQTVTFNNLHYSDVVSFETASVGTYDIDITFDDNNGGYTFNSTLSDNLTNSAYEGDNIVINASPKEGYSFGGWSTNDYIVNGGTFYSGDVSLNFIMNQSIKLYANFYKSDSNSILYEFNGGHDDSGNVRLLVNCDAMLAHHPKANTLIGNNITKDGYRLIGWNTKEDGSGTHIGLGSRAEVKTGDVIKLFAEWRAYTPGSYFNANQWGWICGYLGDVNLDELVIPDVINGVNIVGINTNSFINCNFKKIYLPKTLENIWGGAFVNLTSLTDLYFYDNISYIHDSCFINCPAFDNIHIQAQLSPAYTNTLYSSKLDVYDDIALHKDDKKIVILGGSSAQYAYYSEKIAAAFNYEYRVYNLGLTIMINGLPQMEMILPYMNEGDIFIHAPEPRNPNFYGTLSASTKSNKQDCSSFSIGEGLFYVLENNWDLVSNFTYSLYSDILQWFVWYNNTRRVLISNGGGCSYESFDQSFGPNAPYHNSNGDLNFNFPSHGGDSYFSYRTTTLEDTTATGIKYANTVYSRFLEKGVRVCVTFAPINRAYLEQPDLYANTANANNHINAYTQLVKDNVDPRVNVLLTQMDTVYPSLYFSNSDFHLCRPGSLIHTGKVIDALKEVTNY